MSDLSGFTVPFPRPAEPSMLSRSSSSNRSNPSTPSHNRRPSIPLRPTSPRAVPVPVPQRHGSLYPQSRQPSNGSPLEDFDAASPSLLGHARRSGSSGSTNTSGSILFGPSSLPSSSFLGNGDISIQRSRSERRSSNTRPAVHFRASHLESHDAEGNDKWLDISAEEILATRDDAEARLISGAMVTEEAVEVLIKSEDTYLLVQKASSPAAYGFFDYADLNTFLLLVLQTSSSRDSSSPYGRSEYAPANSYPAMAHLDEESKSYDRTQNLVRLLRRHEKVKVSDVCDISQKDPYYALPATTPLRTLLPLFASGLHRIAITSIEFPPLILTASMLLEHLISLPADLIPPVFHLAVTSPSVDLPLHPLISLPGTASVLDAMQVMSAQGMSALGVLSGSGNAGGRSSRGSSGSSSGSGQMQLSQPSQSDLSSSPLLMPKFSPGLEVTGLRLDSLASDLISVVTAQDCTVLVVPSEGKQVLGMGLEQMVKGLQIVEPAGKTRGEERMPVHTIIFSTTLLHACHLILATASSRVFMRTPIGLSPPLSPTPSLTMSASPPLSPSFSSLSLSDTRSMVHRSTLPTPPPTQLSPYYVISVLDILACLAKAYHGKLTGPSEAKGGVIVAASDSLRAPTWDLDPESMGKRRRASSAATEIGIESWRWVGDVG